MLIRRLQVEEGFLDGLDVAFAPGLNVIIGPRGSGKTSIVELIRFVLGLPGHTDKVTSAAASHAKAVLSSGRVTLTAEEGDEVLTYTRSADERSPRLLGSRPVERPVVLSQNEIEEVGTSVAGRLRLIDAFRPPDGSDVAQETAVAAEIGSLTADLRALAEELEALRETERASEGVPGELVEAQAQEADLLNRLGEAGPDREQLRLLTEGLAAAAVRAGTIVATITSVRAAIDRIRQLSVPTAIVEPWPDNAGPTDMLSDVRTLVDRARVALQGTVGLLEQALHAAEEAERANREQQIRDEDTSRARRARLEALQEGAGAVSRRLAELQVRNSQLEATRATIAEREQRLQAAQRRRDELLDRLDAIREGRYAERVHVVEDLNTKLGPRIHTELRRYGHPVGYQNAVLSALRGSGLQYNTLAPHLASRLSPRELASLVEAGDSAGLAELAGIAEDRAQRVIEHLRGEQLDGILTAQVEDDVDLQLLDGDEYKPTTRLSTGQRCTVVLPILLSHSNQVVVIDQPEDHLDNAFVVETVVRVLLDRSSTAQTILATHNANIPVLGGAHNVVYLGSSGRRGFVRVAAPLEDQSIVAAITSVMEGGAEAFKRRATFYQLT